MSVDSGPAGLISCIFFCYYIRVLWSCSDFITNSYSESWVSVHNQWVQIGPYVTRQLILRQTPKLFKLQFTEIEI